jgi:hypothetical protein
MPWQIGESPPSGIRSYLEDVHDKIERLTALSPGGSARWAIAVASASVIEGRAASMPCPRCGGEYRIHEHTRPFPGVRRVDVSCRHCSTPRALWFKIVSREPN